MKIISWGLALGLAAGIAAEAAHADIVPPTAVKCTVTGVTPAGARFFGFGPATVVGDTTELDLGAKEILGLRFASGAHIGATLRKHPLVKKDIEWAGRGFHEADFVSQANGQHYNAVLVAEEGEGASKITVSLDVVEKRTLGRLTLNSLELDCVRP